MKVVEGVIRRPELTVPVKHFVNFIDDYEL